MIICFLSSVKSIKFQSGHPPGWDFFSHQMDSNFLNKPLLFYLKIKTDYFDLWSNKTKNFGMHIFTNKFDLYGNSRSRFGKFITKSY